MATFTEFLRHFCANFYRLLSSLQTFIEFFDFINVFCYCSYFLNFLSFTDFYRYAPKFTSFFVPTSRKQTTVNWPVYGRKFTDFTAIKVDKSGKNRKSPVLTIGPRLIKLARNSQLICPLAYKNRKCNFVSVSPGVVFIKLIRIIQLSFGHQSCSMDPRYPLQTFAK